MNRKTIIAKALKARGALIHTKDMAEAITLSNQIAPEHLELSVDQKILHTKKPIPSMFELLIEQGEITLDHLIKKDSKGRVSEKGSLFKISTSALSMLFPEQIKYSLVA
jgi:hypothetical protein